MSGGIFVCGDLHSMSADTKKLYTKNIPEQKNLIKNDLLIQLGDFGWLWYPLSENKEQEYLLDWRREKLGRSGKNKVVKQMSQEWILQTINKLVSKIPSKTYSTLKQFILNNQYRARVFRLKPKSNNTIQISIYKVKNKGLKAFDETKDIQLSPIDINVPKGNFERHMVKAYNECRDLQLHKYLSILTNNEITELLKDNYIQKNDVKYLLLR